MVRLNIGRNAGSHSARPAHATLAYLAPAKGREEVGRLMYPSASVSAAGAARLEDLLHGAIKYVVFLVEITFDRDVFRVPTLFASTDKNVFLMSLSKYGDVSLGDDLHKMDYSDPESIVIHGVADNVIDRRKIKREYRNLLGYINSVKDSPLPSVFEEHAADILLGRILERGDFVAVLDKNELDDQIKVDRAPAAVHPGVLVRHYVYNSKLSADFYFSKIPDLEKLINGDLPFDEKFRSEFEKYMGGSVNILSRLQRVYDFEQETGRRHSGKWGTPDAELAP